jgi:hypothetical protein
MTTRMLCLVIASALAGCTTDRLVRDNLLPACPAPTGRATSRAAACMTSAMYEMVLRKSEGAQDRATGDDDATDHETNAR